MFTSSNFSVNIQISLKKTLINQDYKSASMQLRYSDKNDLLRE